MTKPGHVVIEKDKKFSDSYLWSFQREYFDREGIDAWVKDVPHYATSNPFLANCYANMTLRLAQDWVKKYPEAKKHPFYIMELGTGSGQLSFYILKKLKQLKRQWKLEDINICYIMTDFTESNLKFWDSHPALQEFIADQSLDFALFDMEKDSSVQLRKSGATLSAGSIVNPLTVYANYIFDTVTHDAFTIKEGKLFESLVSLSTHKNNMRDGKPVVINDVDVTYTTAELPEKYYEDPIINDVLNSYKNGVLKECQLLLPVAGLRTLTNIRKLCNDKMFLVTTDKGYAQLDELEGLDYPFIDFHGSFSMMVNFHAIAKYFELIGGSAFTQTSRQGVKTNVYCSGFNMEDFTEFAFSVWENVERLSPGDYFMLHRNISENHKICNIDTLAAHMAFTDWDPHIYRKLGKQICEQITRADRSTTDYLTRHMPNLAGNFYYIPQIYDVLFDVGVFMHTLRHFEDALKYYQKSRQFFGEKFDLIYNIGICQYYTGHPKEALESFKYALTFNPNSEEAKKFIEYIENKGEAEAE